MEYDDEVAYHANRKLYDLARGQDDRPWCLTVSFTHPHDPYVARRRYWDLYEDSPALAPQIVPIPYDKQDPHSRRLMDACDHSKFKISQKDVRRARQGYFANLSYIDEKVGEILDTLKRCRMLDNTAIIFASDHGDMLGERGLWFKMSFFEGSLRVPLMIAAPGWTPRRVDEAVSTLDVCPTLAAFAGVEMDELAPWTDGVDLAPIAAGTGKRGPIAAEYAAEGSIAPLVCLRDGDLKLVLCDRDPPMLFDLAVDPLERTNFADDPAYANRLAALIAQANARWDLAAFDSAVRESQARRHVVYQALRNGAYYPWDYQPLQKASERYMRNHLDLNVLEENQRFPRGE
jgi:choline-sulfatase